jgi:hypothetical protein
MTDGTIVFLHQEIEGDVGIINTTTTTTSSSRIPSIEKGKNGGHADYAACGRQIGVGIVSYVEPMRD